MRLRSIICVMFMASVMLVQAQKPKTDEEAEYLKVLQGRSQKIVDNLGIEDQEKALEVRDIIVKQYWDLNKVHDGKKADIKAVKESDLAEDEQSVKIEKIKAKADKQIDKLHVAYIKSLNKNLTPDQVDGVKDGMTYNVMNGTYSAFTDMIPDLTQEQKDTIYSMLEEAREHAMDAGSSKEKHAWFGKYKGRINNYLSKEGYDLNKLSEEWHERLKAKGVKL